MRSAFRVLALAAVALCAAQVAVPVRTVAEARPHIRHDTPPPEARVDINHASLKELLTVPGMTQSWAERIIRFRPYHAKNDLVDHGVVTGRVYARIKDYIIAHRNRQ